MSETFYNDAPHNFWVKNRVQIDAVNWAETFTYFDGLGRAWKSEEVNSQGNIFVEKEFDAEGRVSRVTNPFRASEARIWTTNVYDQASRIREVVLPDGARITTDYGVSTTGVIGVSKQITDQAGKSRKGISDALGRMVRVIEDPAGQNLSTDYVFDAVGNLRRTIQGAQNRYFMHDSLGRLLYAKQPEQDANAAFAATDPVTGNAQWSIRYEYNDNGAITKTTDAGGTFVSGTYDNLGRLMLRDYSDTTPDVNFYYDGKGLGAVPAYSKGRTTKVTSSVSETRYTGFDVFGRLLSHEQVTDGQVYATSYVYNLSGALIEETYPSGRKVRNSLNIDGDLSKVETQKAGGAWEIRADSFAYDSAGAVTSIRLGNNRWETAQYNSRLQVTRIGLGTAAGVQDVLRLDYGYATAGQTDNNGSLREQTITVPAAGANPGFTAVQSYGYDSLNRLQSASETVSGSQTWRQAFNYDRYGNRTFDAAGTTTLVQSNNVTNPVVNQANNRFSAGQGYNYDLAGNVTMNATGMQFVYDAENHQTEARDGGGNVVGQYFYDGEGRRVKKVSATETTVFVYDGGGALVAEYSTAGNPTASVKYLTQDHLGSPRIITDQNGTVVSRTDFGAFGDETMTPQRTSGLGYAAADGVRQDYTGYQKDDESGLEFAQARYYNPAHGRFTSIDPLTASASIRNPQTFNRYSYALNSPYKFTDPLGLLSISTGSCLPCKFADSGGGGGAFNSITGIFDIYYLVTQTTQYQTTADDGNRKANISVTITESLIIDKNGSVVASENSPVVSTKAKSVGSNPILGPELRSIENIVTTAVKLALSNNFSIPILLTILKTETQFGILPNNEGVKHKVSTINPGQFSRQPNGDRAISENDGYTTQQALEINIGKTIGQFNSDYVQAGKTLNERFQLYNSEPTRVAYANKAERTYNSIKSSFRMSRITTGQFYSRTRPINRPLLVGSCGPLSGCPQF